MTSTHVEEMARKMTLTDIAVIAVIVGLILLVGLAMWLPERRRR